MKSIPPDPQQLELDQKIKDLKKINLKLSRLLRHLEEDRRTEKKSQKS